MSELTPERLAEIKQRLDEAQRQLGGREWIDEYKRDVRALIDHVHAQAAEIERMGNKVTEALHALGSEDNPQEALDILYAAYRRYHDELKGRVTNCA